MLAKLSEIFIKPQEEHFGVDLKPRSKISSSSGQGGIELKLRSKTSIYLVF